MPKLESTLHGKGFSPMGANPFLYKMTQIYMRGDNTIDRVASPESVRIHLKYSLGMNVRAECALASVHGLGQQINPHHANCPYSIPLLLNLNRSIHTTVIVGGGEVAGGGGGSRERV